MKHCKKCLSTENLIADRWLCHPCFTAYNVFRAKKRYAKEHERLGIIKPTVVYSCGFEFDPESCPQRQKSARYRARRGQIVQIRACVNCEVKE